MRRLDVGPVLYNQATSYFLCFDEETRYVTFPVVYRYDNHPKSLFFFGERVPEIASFSVYNPK
jgi:hypothetical protein